MKEDLMKVGRAELLTVIALNVASGIIKFKIIRPRETHGHPDVYPTV